MFGLIPFSCGAILDTAGIAFTSITAAYVAGRFRMSANFLKLCDLLKIQSSPNEFIWNDIIDAKYPTKLIIHLDDVIIEGYPINIEEAVRTPIVELVGYSVKNSSSKTPDIDHRHSETEALCVDLEKANYIEIVYYKQSELSDRIVRVCKNNP